MLFNMIKRRCKGLLLLTFLTINGLILTIPQVVFADVSGSKAALKRQGKTVVDNFAEVFKYLSIPVAVLSLILILTAGLIMPDESDVVKTKKIARWVLIIASIIGGVSWIVSIASNK
ncbi:hypothetical protein HCJ46_17075 [Listeria booriae]|uniref:hypothetical protein n=1 Tax=Listeria booriae TaxID=1552123 RepID=UPI001627897E|nr:hypothetical protein [Listeria booriae]MBC1920466.1 hypothetical protein [Listeria booriae]